MEDEAPALSAELVEPQARRDNGGKLCWTNFPGRRVIPAEAMPADIDLERLYDEHALALFAFLLNFTRSESDTRDLLQEIFVKAVRRPDLLAGVREPRAFLIRLMPGSLSSIPSAGTRRTMAEISA